MLQNIAAFRLGNHKLAVETQRYVTPKIPYENRYCPLCSQETENEVHLLFKCNATCYKVERETFIWRIVEMVKHFEHLSEQDKAFYIMSQENEHATALLADYIGAMTQIREKCALGIIITINGNQGNTV